LIDHPSRPVIGLIAKLLVGLPVHYRLSRRDLRLL
jgi:hypothetical protein